MSAPETSTAAGRLRLLTWLAADPGGKHLTADVLPWVADRLRSDLPLLLELHNAVLCGDEPKVAELCTRLDDQGWST